MKERTPISTPLSDTQTGSRRLTLLFIAAYVAHGLSTQFGLIAQPLQFFMMKGLSLSSAQVSAYLSVMMLPWVLKPFYGLVCDFIPLFGYRRKSYLIAVNLATSLAFIVMACSSSLPIILGALIVAAVGMAASTAITVGLAVEPGKSSARARNYFAIQTMVYYSALIVASLVGGWLCHTLAPLISLHTAASIAAIPALCVAVVTIFLLEDGKSSLNKSELTETFKYLKEVLKQRSFWLISLFVWCWDFSPSFGVPLYFYETNFLKFSQAYIGQLAAWNACGMVIGSISYRWLLKKNLSRGSFTSQSPSEQSAPFRIFSSPHRSPHCALSCSEV